MRLVSFIKGDSRVICNCVDKFENIKAFTKNKQTVVSGITRKPSFKKHNVYYGNNSKELVIADHMNAMGYNTNEYTLLLRATTK